MRKLGAQDKTGSPPKKVGRPAKTVLKEKKARSVEGLPSEAQLADLLALAQGDLSDLEKEVFDLYLGGMRYKDIANRCNLDVKSVDNALLRAKNKIKKRAGRA